MSHLHHFQVLEINVVSAQDLAAVQKTKSMQTYAVVWVHPGRKLTTRVDGSGHTNPTWNDKFVFRVDDRFLNSEHSAINIEIYAVSWLRDTLVGTVRVLIHNLLPPSTRSPQSSAIRFVALQIRRPSGRPQGILNMGVTLLDSTMRSMPLFGQFTASALGYKDLVGETTESLRPNSQVPKDMEEKSSGIKVLRRAQSEISLPVSDGKARKTRPMINGGSTLNGSDLNGSFLSGSNLNGSTVNGSIVWGPPRPGGSVCSDVGPSPSVVAAAMAKIYKDDDVSSSILGEWTVNRREEGLKSKIQRWRADIPVRYENDPRKKKPKPPKSSRHPRQSNGPRLFTCFGNAYGCEFTIVCGTGNSKKMYSRKPNLPIAPYEDNASQSYM
ncbi:C2 domain [Dillenia turbinata]|uniref:C2 domain n=1 Tax=Dillenia turbinata TaxID=194707 RepID=A0AAN8YWW6_9MAGN